MIENTIIAMRCVELTTFFKFFPFLVSDTFYIGVIMLGYWLSSNTHIFWKLGFLVPFSTLITSILKNLFNISRPDQSLYLVKIIDKSTGFPSGDVLVTVVFWGMLMSCYQSKIFRIIASLIILCVMVSRIYLGVHSFAQVVGGLFFGVIIVRIALSNFGNNIFDSWTKGQTRTYWTTVLITVFICSTTSKIIMPLVFGITGILAGYGLCFGMTERYINAPKMQSRFLLGSAGTALIWMVNYIFPKVHFEQVAVADVIFIVKYFIVSLIIFGLIPYFQLKSKKLLIASVRNMSL